MKHGLLIDLPDVDDVHRTRQSPRYKTVGVVEVVPGPPPLLVVIDPTQTSVSEVRIRPRRDLDRRRRPAVEGNRVVDVPVVYDGPDLEEVARLTRMRAGESRRPASVRDLHGGVTRLQPGLPAYLLGLDPALYVPRLRDAAPIGRRRIRRHRRRASRRVPRYARRLAASWVVPASPLTRDLIHDQSPPSLRVPATTCASGHQMGSALRFSRSAGSPRCKTSVAAVRRTPSASRRQGRSTRPASAWLTGWSATTKRAAAHRDPAQRRPSSCPHTSM